MERKLNIDPSDSISELRYFLKHFLVRTKRWKIFFRGKSFEFDGYRVYTPDDDVSSIDWKASSRSSQLLVRQYKEEEEKKVIFLLDVGETMINGSTDKLKCEYSSEIVLSLVDLLVNFNERAGLILYNEKIKNYFPPKRGTNLFNIYKDTLSNPDTYGGGSDLSEAVEFVTQTFDRSVSSVIIVSDFLRFNKKAKHSLDVLTSKFETMAFFVKDPIDIMMPDISGEFIVSDPKTGQQLLVDPKIAKRVYQQHAEEQEKKVKECLKDSGIDFINFYTDKPYVHDLINFLEGRVKRG